MPYALSQGIDQFIPKLKDLPGWWGENSDNSVISIVIGELGTRQCEPGTRSLGSPLGGAPLELLLKDE